MKIAVVGLGLIGGSIAKACKQAPENVVLGVDIDKSVGLKAKLLGAVDRVIEPCEIGEAEVVFVALNRGAAISFVKENAARIAHNAIVLDCAGTKRAVCEELFGVAAENGFVFIGAHPMAGREFSGFEYSRDNLFDNASMLLTPPAGVEIAVLAKVKRLCEALGFAEVVVTTAEKHDAIIAYTSQLAHVISNAFVKSPTGKLRRGFSAGSYKDMTRVARMNVPMWRELFLDNRDNLLVEIDGFIKNMTDLRDAIGAKNAEKLAALLELGVQCKIESE